MDLPAPVAVVTGAGNGIGRATARRLRADGLAVLATDVRRPPGDDELLALDLTADDAATVLFDEAERRYGSVGVLVHSATASLLDTFASAGPDWAGRSVQRLDAGTVDRQFAVDARAGALLIAEFAERLRRRSGRGGRIVVLTSGGEDGFPGEVSYGAAKAALVNYAMSAATELRPLGVAVNALHPPVTDTGWVTPAVHEAVAADRRFFSVADPEEVAAAIAVLVGPAGSRITGNTIRMG